VVGGAVVGVVVGDAAPALGACAGGCRAVVPGVEAWALPDAPALGLCPDRPGTAAATDALSAPIRATAPTTTDPVTRRRRATPISRRTPPPT
jgi:hypothetical protein